VTQRTTSYPVRGRDSNGKKTITAKHNFGFKNHCTVKLIASYNDWLNAYCNFGAVSFKTVEDFLSKRTPEATKKFLVDYAKSDIEGFSWDFFQCIVQANAINPKFIKRQRGSLYGLTEKKRNEVTGIILHLTEFLRRQRKLPASDRHPLLKPLLKHYNVPEMWLNKNLDEFVRKIVEKYFNLTLGDHYRRDFIYNRKMTTKRVKSLRNVSPENSILTPLFERFKESS
jgi:hypothetical protein